MTNKLILRLLIAILELLARPGTSPYHRNLLQDAQKHLDEL